MRGESFSPGVASGILQRPQPNNWCQPGGEQPPLKPAAAVYDARLKVRFWLLKQVHQQLADAASDSLLLTLR